MENQSRKSIGVMTSGGDAQGMNAAVRAVVRTALSMGADVYAIYEGYQGMVDAGDAIRKMDWSSVGGILHRGGTVIGTARCQAFRTKEGREIAAKNLIKHGIDGLVIIGGDGSLTGANIFREEWGDHIKSLLEKGEITPEEAEQYPELSLVGLVGSIDNDMFGTDMTIGADSALHRITEAIDAIASTAASHQRTFVVEVMGRHCGYLALMSAIATGANWVFIPENPPTSDNWEEEMCDTLLKGRSIGRRMSTVVVAEGAQDKYGNPITSQRIKEILQERLAPKGEDIRVTILGHVQRGGAPSAFDRNLATMLGNTAVKELLSAGKNAEPDVIGIRENKIIKSNLMASVQKTHSVAERIKEHDYEEAMRLRGGSFAESTRIFETLTRVSPYVKPNTGEGKRIAVMHSSAPAPGMNAAVRATVRVALDQGHEILAIRNGFKGFIRGDIKPMNWMSVTDWVRNGGAELGTNRSLPEEEDYAKIAEVIKEYNIDALLMIGGWTGYETAYRMIQKRDKYEAFNIPIVCMPASIDNNLPGSEYSIGTDTALNSIVENIDRIKQSAVATQRCFVVEVMGRYCGYLAVMSALATGAERVYIHEQGLSLAQLSEDLDYLVARFKNHERLGLFIRSENADPFYTTDFICSVLEKEGGDLFDVRKAVLGHIQQGGDPTPFDRIQATRMASRCVDYIVNEAGASTGVCIGLMAGRIAFTDLHRMPELADMKYHRPKDEWWLDRAELAMELSNAQYNNT